MVNQRAVVFKIAVLSQKERNNFMDNKCHLYCHGNMTYDRDNNIKSPFE